MARLVIYREKSMVGMLMPMDCYVDGQRICKVKNGEKEYCEIDNAVISFKCNLPSSPMSDVVYLDMSAGKTVTIKVKQGVSKPSVTVMDESVITTQTPSSIRTSVVASYNLSQSDLRSAMHAMKKTLDIRERTDELVTSNGVTFTPTREVGDYFAIDENVRHWAVVKGGFLTQKTYITHSYEDIVDFELIEDGSSVVKGGVGRAIVGGILFGGVGAVVGGATGKKKVSQTCTNLMIKITVNNMAEPVEYIKLISSTVRKDSMYYRGAYHDAQKIISMLQLICNQKNSNNEEVKGSAQQGSSVDEIRRYKELLDDGIITEEEFLLKKKQLLGI